VLLTRVVSLPLGTSGRATHDFGATAWTGARSYVVWRDSDDLAAGAIETAVGTCTIPGQTGNPINWNCLLDWDGQITWASANTGASIAHSSYWQELAAHWSGP
jgi:hypothetical protein